MSRCRCSDINICEEYISRLNNADYEIGCCESRFQNIPGYYPRWLCIAGLSLKRVMERAVYIL